jgi:DNA-binding FadR family transcriptional regulator
MESWGSDLSRSYPEDGSKFDEVKVQPAHELVQARIRQAIGLGIYGPGDRLPQERELAEHMGVSRATVRQAMAVLGARGYVESKRGSTGGWFVTSRRGDDAEVLHVLAKSLPRLDNVLDFRIIVESAAAALAAHRRLDRDLQAMDDAIGEIEAAADIASFRRSDTAFHLAVARATGNSMLQNAVKEARLTTFFLVDMMDYEVGLHRSSVTEHRAIYEAVQGQDQESARKAMVDHIEATRKALHSAIKGEQPYFNGPPKAIKKRTFRSVTSKDKQHSAV